MCQHAAVVTTAANSAQSSNSDNPQLHDCADCNRLFALMPNPPSTPKCQQVCSLQKQHWTIGRHRTSQRLLCTCTVPASVHTDQQGTHTTKLPAWQTPWPVCVNGCRFGPASNCWPLCSNTPHTLSPPSPCPVPQASYCLLQYPSKSHACWHGGACTLELLGLGVQPTTCAPQQRHGRHQPNTWWQLCCCAALCSSCRELSASCRAGVCLPCVPPGTGWLWCCL